MPKSPHPRAWPQRMRQATRLWLRSGPRWRRTLFGTLWAVVAGCAAYLWLTLLTQVAVARISPAIHFVPATPLGLGIHVGTAVLLLLLAAIGEYVGLVHDDSEE